MTPAACKRAQPPQEIENMGNKQKKQKIARLVAAARGYRDQISEIVDGIDRMVDLRERQLDRLRLDSLLARACYEDLDAAIAVAREDDLLRALAPYVQADAMRQMFVDYAEAGPDLGDLVDLAVAGDRQDLTLRCGLVQRAVGL